MGVNAMGECELDVIVDWSVESDRKADHIRTNALIIRPAQRHLGSSSQHPGLATPYLP